MGSIQSFQPNAPQTSGVVSKITTTVSYIAQKTCEIAQRIFSWFKETWHAFMCLLGLRKMPNNLFDASIPQNPEANILDPRHPSSTNVPLEVDSSYNNATESNLSTNSSSQVSLNRKSKAPCKLRKKVKAAQKQVLKSSRTNHKQLPSSKKSFKNRYILTHQIAQCAIQSKKTNDSTSTTGEIHQEAASSNSLSKENRSQSLSLSSRSLTSIVAPLSTALVPVTKTENTSKPIFKSIESSYTRARAAQTIQADSTSKSFLARSASNSLLHSQHEAQTDPLFGLISIEKLSSLTSELSPSAVKTIQTSRLLDRPLSIKEMTQENLSSVGLQDSFYLNTNPSWNSLFRHIQSLPNHTFYAYLNAGALKLQQNENNEAFKAALLKSPLPSFIFSELKRRQYATAQENADRSSQLVENDNSSLLDSTLEKTDNLRNNAQSIPLSLNLIDHSHSKESSRFLPLFRPLSLAGFKIVKSPTSFIGWQTLRPCLNRLIPRCALPFGIFSAIPSNLATSGSLPYSTLSDSHRFNWMMLRQTDNNQGFVTKRNNQQTPGQDSEHKEDLTNPLSSPVTSAFRIHNGQLMSPKIATSEKKAYQGVFHYAIERQSYDLNRLSNVNSSKSAHSSKIISVKPPKLTPNLSATFFQKIGRHRSKPLAMGLSAATIAGATLLTRTSFEGKNIST